MTDGEPPPFYGHQPRECGEHRTVGPHRAWCHDCGEWCYPDPGMACGGCRTPVPEGHGPRYSFTRDQLTEALTRLEAYPATLPGRDKPVLIAESMADAIIEALEDGAGENDNHG